MLTGTDMTLTAGGKIGSAENALKLTADSLIAKADKDITLETTTPLLKEITSANGNIKIDSKYNDVIELVMIESTNGNADITALDDVKVGTAKAYDMLTIIAGESMMQTSGDGVSGRRVAMYALNGFIGEKDNYFTVNSDKKSGLYRLVAAKDVYATGFDANARISKIESREKDITVSSKNGADMLFEDLGEVALTDPHLVGNVITLSSNGGAIGSNKVFGVAESRTGKTNLDATHGIHLTHIGDMLSDYVLNRQSGNIELRNTESNIQIKKIQNQDRFHVIFDKANDSMLEIGYASPKNTTLLQNITKLESPIFPVRISEGADVPKSLPKKDNNNDEKDKKEKEWENL
jgi:hypothetical protein